jgi:hypothetical protein
MFRDIDGTGSSPQGLWKMKYDAVRDGFGMAQFAPKGVPMLPMPKSEAWLLCAAKDDPYRDCQQLEQLSGNDRAPEPLKDMLSAALDGKNSAQEVREWLFERPYDHESACQMPSFQKFKEDLLVAVRSVL